MQVKVPNVLVAGRLVVLPRRNTVAPVGCFQGDGYLLGKIENMAADLFGHVIEIFDMLVGNDNDVSRI